VRIVLLAVVAAFPFLFGVSFAVSIFSLRLPTAPGARGGRPAAVTAGLVKALVYAGLAFAVAAALHQALNESWPTAAALTVVPFVAGAIAAPALASRLGRRSRRDV
jgi:hypothetical protein